MTYTTVHKDYEAATLEEAAAAFFHDSDLWSPLPGRMVSDHALVGWEWTEPALLDRLPGAAPGRLRCWFR